MNGWPRSPVRVIARDGKEIVLAPLPFSGWARLYPEDWNRLALAGFCERQWTLAGHNHYVTYRPPGDRRRFVVARLIVNAVPGDQVQYYDGDRTNLRRENLWVKQTKLRRRTIPSVL